MCNLVFGRGPKAGSAIVQHPDVPLISFTGSTATGQAITQMSAPFFKKLSLEVSKKLILLIILCRNSLLISTNFDHNNSHISV